MELHHTLCQRENGLWGDGSMGKVLAVNTQFLSMNLENPYGRAGHGNTQCSYRDERQSRGDPGDDRPASLPNEVANPKKLFLKQSGRSGPASSVVLCGPINMP